MTTQTERDACFENQSNAIFETTASALGSASVSFFVWSPERVREAFAVIKTTAESGAEAVLSKRAYWHTHNLLPIQSKIERNIRYLVHKSYSIQSVGYAYLLWINYHYIVMISVAKQVYF